MTAEQLTLGSHLPTQGALRRSDPRTSQDAAQSFDEATLNREQQRCLDALRLLASNCQPMTTGRVTRLLGDRQRNCVSRRIADLAQAGVVRDSGETFREDHKGARSEIVWVVVQ